MINLQAQNFKAIDFLTMEIGETEKEYRKGQDIAEWAMAHEKAGPALTFKAEDNIVFCAGVHDIWPGVGAAWSVISPRSYKYCRMLWAMKWCVRELFDKLSYIRIQVGVDAQNETAIRFIEHLGFVREGYMRKFGPHGEDHYLYAIVKG
jgi:hypothetical protein